MQRVHKGPKANRRPTIAKESEQGQPQVAGASACSRGETGILVAPALFGAETEPEIL